MSPARRGVMTSAALKFLACTVLLLIVLVISLSVGRYPLSLFSLDSESKEILFAVRFPRVLMAVIAGAVLGSSSTALQAVFRNPLASPYILGVTQGAAFGAGLAMLLLPPNPLAVTLFALVFALLAVAVVLALAKVHGATSPLLLVLSGVVVGAMFTAGLSAIQWLIDPWRLQGLVFWLMGGLYRVTWEKYAVSIPGVAVGLALLMLMRWRLDLLSLSDDEARSLGVDVERERLVIVSAAALSIASITCSTGIIAFIGLVIPHIARPFFGSENRVLLPASALVGGIVVLLADTLCRSLLPMEIPISIVTTLISVPYLAYLLRKVASGWAT